MSRCYFCEITAAKLCKMSRFGIYPKITFVFVLNDQNRINLAVHVLRIKLPWNLTSALSLKYFVQSFLLREQQHWHYFPINNIFEVNFHHIDFNGAASWGPTAFSFMKFQIFPFYWFSFVRLCLNLEKILI